VSKPVTGNARRRPPEPAADHAGVDAWIDEQMPRLQAILRDVDESIRDLVPGVHFAVKFKRAFYGLPELGWIVELAPYDVSANVLFLGGADFNPPPPLGTNGRTRYVKLTDLDDAQDPELHNWIQQAGHTPGWT
jgi:hypothetical protein